MTIPPKKESLNFDYLITFDGAGKRKAINAFLRSGTGRIHQKLSGILSSTCFNTRRKKIVPEN